MPADQSEQIALLLQGKPGKRGRSGSAKRLSAAAAVWAERTGPAWRDSPLAFGSWTSTDVRFARWLDKQVWHEVVAALRQDADFKKV